MSEGSGDGDFRKQWAATREREFTIHLCVFRGACGVCDVCTRKRSRHAGTWEAIQPTLVTDTNDNTYPNSDMSDPQINGTATWPAELDRAIDLYRVEKFRECIAHTRTVCRDNTPLYPRLRYRILLASCLDDWHEAEDMRFHAENTYNSWCLYNPVSSFPGAAEVRSDLRTNLDQLAEYLKTFRPEDWKETQRFWNVIEAAEAEEEYAAQFSEEEDEEEEEEEEGIEEQAATAQSAENDPTAQSEEETATVHSEEEAVLGA
jgi:hypothetical protein